jgi:hypothetical protein
MNKIPLVLFNNQSDAEPLLKRLVENGIPTRMTACQPHGSVRLEVPDDQFGRVYHLLVDWDVQDGALRRAIRCPECRSLRVEYPQYSHKSILPNLLVGFLVTIGAADKEFYCHDCHFTWPREGIKPSPLRPHAAPYYFIDGIEQSPSEKPQLVIQ